MDEITARHSHNIVQVPWASWELNGLEDLNRLLGPMDSAATAEGG